MTCVEKVFFLLEAFCFGLFFGAVFCVSSAAFALTY